MPIAPAHSWSETEAALTVTATCRGATTANTDVFSSPHYVSVNAPPFFLELDLHGSIDGAASTTTVRGGEVILRLVKTEPALWGRLLADLPRAARLRRRAESRERAETAAREAAERKKTKLWEDQRYVLGKQMDADRAGRERLEQLKADEKAAEAAKLASFVDADAERAAAPPAARQAEAVAAAAAAAADADARSKPPAKAKKAKAKAAAAGTADEVPPLDDAAAAAAADAAAATPAAEPAPAPAPPPPPPPPRTTGKVRIKFTPKLLAAPARSKGAEADMEIENLAAPTLKPLGAPGEGDISQRDPAWLKERGDRYYLLRDFASAEGAYTMVLAQFANKIIAQARDAHNADPAS